MNPALVGYARTLRAGWRWIAWGVIGALALAAAALLLLPPQYQSRATVFVRTPGDISQVRDGGDSYAQARAETYAALAKGTGIAARVVADMGLKISPEKLAGRVSAGHPGGTALIQIAVNAPTPDESRRTAEVLLNELAAEMRALEAVPGSVVPRAELVLVDPPRVTRVVAFGAPLYRVVIAVVVIGAFLGAIGAAIRSPQQRSREVEDQ